MSALKLTEQQTHIVNLAKSGVNIKIEAKAGAAKTTTLALIANAIHKPSRLICFNKAIATEAAKRFPSYVICQTLHSVAWGNVVKNMKSLESSCLSKNSGNLSVREVRLTDVQNRSADKEPAARYEVIRNIGGFCQSAFESLEIFLTNVELEFATKEEITDFWNRIVAREVAWSHDVYLKIFHLSKPIFSEKVIYLDEGQDSNPVTLAIFNMQTHAQRVIVGDSYQSIYAWRGAVNALALPYFNDHFISASLNESFRFTPEIARIAQKLVNVVDKDDKVIGLQKYSEPKTFATLFRTNLAILNELMLLHRNSYGSAKVNVEADLDSIFRKLYHIGALASEAEPRYPDSTLIGFRKYPELLAAAEHDPELQQLVNCFISLSKGGLHQNIVDIKATIDKKGESNITFSTIHKSKGLEWDSVTLAPDVFKLPTETEAEDADFEEEFPDLDLSDLADNKRLALALKLLAKDQRLELLYVAVTRAKFELNLPEGVTQLLALI